MSDPVEDLIGHRSGKVVRGGGRRNRTPVCPPGIGVDPVTLAFSKRPRVQDRGLKHQDYGKGWVRAALEATHDPPG